MSDRTEIAEFRHHDWLPDGDPAQQELKFKRRSWSGRSLHSGDAVRFRSTTEVYPYRGDIVQKYYVHPDDQPQTDAVHPMQDLEFLCPEVHYEQLAEEARRRCRRRIRAVARRPVLLTLTIAENLTGDEGRERFHTAFKRFLRTLRDFGLRFPYVAIAEYQARGARHYHLAIPPDYIDYKIVWSHWNNALAHCGFGKGANGKYGGVHFGGYSRGENIRGYKAVANYLTKYMLKNEGDEECRIGKTHRFTSTRGLIFKERHGRYDVQVHTGYEHVVRRIWSKRRRRMIEYHTRERRTYHNRDFKWSAITMSAAQVRERLQQRDLGREGIATGRLDLDGERESAYFEKERIGPAPPPMYQPPPAKKSVRRSRSK